MNAKDAFQAATHVYTEVNLKEPSVVKEIQQCRQLPGGKTLKDVLPRNIFLRLRKAINSFERRRRRWLQSLNRYANYMGKEMYELQEVNLYQQYKKLRPIWLTTTILGQWNKFNVKMHMRSAEESRALDDFLVSQASEVGAYKGGIEDVRMHCDPLNSLSQEKVSCIVFCNHVSL